MPEAYTTRVPSGEIAIVLKVEGAGKETSAPRSTSSRTSDRSTGRVARQYSALTAIRPSPSTAVAAIQSNLPDLDCGAGCAGDAVPSDSLRSLRASLIDANLCLRS